MSKRGRKQPGTEKVQFVDRIDEDLERRRLRQERRMSARKQKPEKTWVEGIEEAGREPRERARKERRARVAAFYSDLRIEYNTGNLSDNKIIEYLEDFPASAEYQAFEKINNFINRGVIDNEIEKRKDEIEEELKSLEYTKLTKRERIAQKRNKMLREAVLARLGKKGPPQTPETGEDIFSAGEWEGAILREYADGNISEDDVKHFFDYYSDEKRDAYQKLADEEGLKVRSGVAPEDKLTQKEVEGMLLRGLGFREEFVKDIPTEEGKTIFEEMLDEQIESFKQILYGTISREDLDKKTAELGGDREKAEKELIAESGKKFLAVRELFTHGVLSYDKKNGRMVLNRYSDLDGKCAIALLGKIGIDISKVGYLTPGEKKQGQITFDSSGADGLVQDSTITVDPKTGERKIEITTAFDHHGPHSHRGTSSTRVAYEVFTKLGLLEFQDEKEKESYEKVVEWVTQSDNFDFPDMEKYFDTSDRRMIGFIKFLNFDRLLKFADSGKKITDILSLQELRKFGLIFKDRKTGKMVDRTRERRGAIEETKRKVRELAGRGFLIRTKDAQKFLIDTTGEAGGEFQWAAASLGYDGIIRYNETTHGFVVALNKGEFDPKIFKNLSQGKMIRKSMFFQPMGQEKLEVTLGDLIGRLAPDFEPGPKTELRRFLDREPWRIRAVVSKSSEGWWWTNAPDGKRVVARGLPEGFKSGSEAYLILKEPREIRPNEKRKYGGDFYLGYWESDEIIPPETRRAEKKVITPKPEVKKSVMPEAKAAPPVEPEIKPATPKTEKERTLEERKRIEEEIAAGKKEIWDKVFKKFIENLEASSVWGKRSEEERKRVAKNAADIEARTFEQNQRKKYGV